MNRAQEVVRFAGILTQFFKMLIINNWTPIIYNQNFKYSPEPIIYNRELYIMKPQGSSVYVSPNMRNLPVLEMALPFPVMVPLLEMWNPISNTV